MVLKNLPLWRTVVSLIKNGSGIVLLKIFYGYEDQNKKAPQYVHFRCGRVHFNNLLKRMGISYKKQSCLLKQELEHDEFYDETWEDKENERLLYIKNDVLSTAFSDARYAKGMEELTGFGMKNS